MFSERDRYVLKLLAYLSRLKDNTRLTIEELCNRTKIPRGYLGKIVRLLSNKGYLDTLKGPNGGVKLANDARSIQVTQLFEDLGTLKHNTTEPDLCCITDESEECNLSEWLNLFKEDVLGSTTIDDLSDSTISKK